MEDYYILVVFWVDVPMRFSYQHPSNIIRDHFVIRDMSGPGLGASITIVGFHVMPNILNRNNEIVIDEIHNQASIWGDYEELQRRDSEEKALDTGSQD